MDFSSDVEFAKELVVGLALQSAKEDEFVFRSCMVFISKFKEEVIDFVLHLPFLGTNMPWVYDFVSCSIGEVVGPDSSLIFLSFNEGYSKIFLSAAKVTYLSLRFRSFRISHCR